MPTLVIVGALDQPDILAITDLLAERVGLGRKVVIQGATHMVTMEKPDGVNRMVRGFLAAVAKD